MKKIIVNLIILSLLFTACTNNNFDKTNGNTDNMNNEISGNSEAIENPGINDGIDRSEYLTGEIITDGNYGFSSNIYGVIYFVPDIESSQIIKDKYNEIAESFILMYNDMSKVENLPKELGIYKVRVKIEVDKTYKYLLLNDIQLTDKLGTVLYEGKAYETNELDESVKVKDIVCGLIVKWIDRFNDGIQIRFAGEIETEGYYFINYDEMYDSNVGRIYFDEENYNSIPIYKEKSHNNFYFTKTNKLFDELENFSSFGRGRFKTSNYSLVYNIGMGRDASDYLAEIISLDENYNNMFNFNKDKFVGPRGFGKDFIVISSANYDDNSNYISNDFYYINKNKPEKLLLFKADSYRYELVSASDENEIILSTDGLNYITGKQDEEHTIICMLTENGFVTEKIEGNNLASNEINEQIKQEILYDIKAQSKIKNIEISDIKKNQDSYYIVVEENTDDIFNKSYKLFKYNKEKGPELLLEGKKIKLLVKGNYYYVNYDKDFEDDLKNEIIKYDFNDVDYKKVIYSGESLEFNISPNNEYMCIENNNNEILLLNQNDEIIFNRILYNNAANAEEIGGVEIKINKWTKDSKQLWIATGLHAYLTTFHIIDFEYLTIETIDSNKSYGISEIDLNADKGCIVYSTHPEFYDVDSYNEFMNSKETVHLYLKKFITDETTEISTSVTKRFNPKWIDDNAIEYNDPNSEARILYKYDNISTQQ